MKKLIILLVFVLMLTACGTNKDNKELPRNPEQSVLEGIEDNSKNIYEETLEESMDEEILGYNDDMTWNDAYDMYAKIAIKNAEKIGTSQENVDLSSFIVSFEDKSYEFKNGMVDFNLLYSTFPADEEDSKDKFLKLVNDEEYSILRYIVNVKDENGDSYMKNSFTCEEQEDVYDIYLMAIASKNITEGVSVAGINVLTTEEEIIKILGIPDEIYTVNISGTGCIIHYEWNNIKGTSSVICEYHIGPSEVDGENFPVMKWMESFDILYCKN